MSLTDEQLAEQKLKMLNERLEHQAELDITRSIQEKQYDLNTGDNP